MPWFTTTQGPLHRVFKLELECCVCQDFSWFQLGNCLVTSSKLVCQTDSPCLDSPSHVYWKMEHQQLYPYHRLVILTRYDKNSKVCLFSAMHGSVCGAEPAHADCRHKVRDRAKALRDTLLDICIHDLYKFISTDHNMSCRMNIPIPMVVPSTSEQHKHEHITRWWIQLSILI